MVDKTSQMVTLKFSFPFFSFFDQVIQQKPQSKRLWYNINEDHDSHGSLSLAPSCLCVHLCVLVCAYSGWYYLPPCFPPIQKINHPDVSLFCCWLFLTLNIKQKHLSHSLSLASPPSFPPQPWGNVFFVNGRVVSGGVPASVGLLFHLQFDFKQTCLIKLRCIWEDLSFSRSWRAEQRDGLAVTPLQRTPLFCKNKTLILPSASQVSGYVY